MRRDLSSVRGNVPVECSTSCPEVTNTGRDACEFCSLLLMESLSCACGRTEPFPHGSSERPRCTHLDLILTRVFFTMTSVILVFGALHSITSALIRPGFAQLLCTRSWKPSEGSKPGQRAHCSTWLVVSVFRAAASCFAWWLLLLNLNTLSYLKVGILKWAFLVYGLLLLLWLLLDKAKVFYLWSANFSVCLQYLCAYGIEAEWTEQRE